jgi:hypothetical protein
MRVLVARSHFTNHDLKIEDRVSRSKPRFSTTEPPAFGDEFAEPFLAHDDDVRGHPCAKLRGNGVGSIALRGEGQNRRK